MKPGKEAPMRTERTYIARNPSSPVVSGTRDGGAAAGGPGLASETGGYNYDRDLHEYDELHHLCN